MIQHSKIRFEQHINVWPNNVQRRQDYSRIHRKHHLIENRSVKPIVVVLPIDRHYGRKDQQTLRTTQNLRHDQVDESRIKSAQRNQFANESHLLKRILYDALFDLGLGVDRILDISQ